MKDKQARFGEIGPDPHGHEEVVEAIAVQIAGSAYPLRLVDDAAYGTLHNGIGPGPEPRSSRKKPIPGLTLAVDSRLR